MNWKEVIKKYPEANFLQSPSYQKMNEILGNKVIVEDFGGLGYAVMVIRKAKRGKYLEVPCGPLTNWDDQEGIKTILSKIREIATKEKCVFARIRPQLRSTPENLALLGSLGLRKSPMHLAAEHTVMIDLNKSEDELLVVADPP